MYAPVMKVLAEREKKIAAGVAAAERAEKAEKETEGARAGIIADANKDAEAIVARAETEGKKERAELVHADRLQLYRNLVGRAGGLQSLAGNQL